MNMFEFILIGSSMCFMVGGIASFYEIVNHKEYAITIGATITFGTLLMGIAIALRWIEVGQGPFLTMYEILISSIFSLGLVLSIAYWRSDFARVSVLFALSVILLLFFWAATVNPAHKPLPPTYQTPWLWVHVITGKIFLGCCLVAFSTSILKLLPESWQTFMLSFRRVKISEIERVAMRWLTIAFAFHSSMLIAGAIWAQDAWGRYWSWDPLETWAFATWLVMAIGLHFRSAFSHVPRTTSIFVVLSFIMAFVTFFGIPFVSMAPHKGAV